jgi:hypothetical protein
MSSNIVIEKNMSRYDLIVDEYSHHYGEQKMCFFTWLLHGNSGETVIWAKGERLDLGYLASKTNSINIADMVGIMSGLRALYPEWIGNLRIPKGFESYE